MKPPVAHEARPERSGDPVPSGTIVLAWEQRVVRRKLLECEEGGQVLVDLAKVSRLDHGARLILADGRHVEVIAADEPLAEASGPALARLAWHIGNRHTPCQIEAERLLIQRDHVLEDMLRGLGATIRHVREPFRPEGGAYANGGAHGQGHSHG